MRDRDLEFWLLAQFLLIHLPELFVSYQESAVSNLTDTVGLLRGLSGMIDIKACCKATYEW